ncbi:DUF418 domain-containing protein [Paenibacillus sp. LHD-38]|uniref:DUF418 domain-containing protein n=1 Tax=Paenibacillus sp. LHD-38 TaxID=3072143 RepID=UPI00280F6538|nr:DUF418 domain-containing protein [Paenibacillus sp. LHD-38]MDQ8738281.1 DUF418 domain-containing protein [Paenibacillus sp. LHD-38]
MGIIKQFETSSRIRIIDVIRGFCLLGILLANMLIFQYGIYGKEELQHFNPSRMDEVMHQSLQIVVEGSFMPIFMFLFGYGLYKLREGLMSKGIISGGSLVRRFIMLIALGLMHSLLLWEGDILLAYGVTGFCLLLFVKRKPKTLIIWGIALTLLLAGISYGAEEGTPKEQDRMQEYVMQSISIYGDGTYEEIMDFRLNEDPLDLPLAGMVALMILMPLLMLPMFLFGIAAAKAQWFHNPERERRRYAFAAASMLPLGILLKSLGVLQPDWVWSGVVMHIGASILALGYIFGLALILSFLAKSSLVISAFEAVGRMSMTNYLMQTVICTTLFYGYGLGWFGEIGMLNGLLLALFIYAVQAVVSSIILFRFKNGPLERLLRMWTYWSVSGKPRSIRKLADHPVVDVRL